MMRKLVLLTFLLSFVGLAHGESRRLWYDKPASNWLEALPVGNSHLGAMVYADSVERGDILVGFAPSEQ